MSEEPNKSKKSPGKRTPKRTASGEQESIQPTITDVRGFKAWGAYSGVKSKRRDLALIVSDRPASAAAVFTTNQVVAEPVKLSRELIRNGRARAFVINAGNANACTGDQGRRGAEAMVAETAECLGIDRNEVIVSSTGIIGQTFPTEKVVAGIREASTKLSELRLAGTLAANAILTTDTFAKLSFSRFKIGGKRCSMGGIAKGSGMIHPNMATMLGFVVCDAAISPALLDKALHEAVDVSFNMITVDGDTSTNDMVAVMANGAAGAPEITDEDEAYATFRDELKSHCVELARLIVSDGEGSTKLMQYDVEGAPDDASARKIARTVSDSSLVKTAFFGRDPNWGRIVAAAGRAGIEYDADQVDLYLGTSKSMRQLLAAGQPVEVSRKALKSMMRASHLYVLLDLNQGPGKATAWGCDMSYDYVRINAEYST